MKNIVRNKELSILADKAWSGSWVEFNEWGNLQVLRYNERLEENEILLDISLHPNAREAMKAALSVLAGVKNPDLVRFAGFTVSTTDD